METIKSYTDMEERKYSELRMPLDDDDKLATEVTIDGNKITPPENYLIGKITKVDNGMLVELVKKKPQYPKTHIECCEILYPNENFQLVAQPIKGHNGKKLFALQKILICRDAYWKIAGEQMGLGKPWVPDWENKEDTKYCITKINNQVKLLTTDVFNYLLTFPTAEMGNAFKENFDGDIDACKDFL